MNEILTPNEVIPPWDDTGSSDVLEPSKSTHGKPKPQMRFSELTQIMISNRLKLPIGRLIKIARNIESYYHESRFQETKPGKSRIIDEPKPWLKAKLRLLHDLLQECRFFHRAAHGGVRGRSCFTAARHHLGKKAVSTRDIMDCYPSVTSEQFRKKLIVLGFRSDTAFLLSGFLTCRDRIPQGSPTSNDALNLYLYDLDKFIAEKCGSDISFTRNADDHVISGNNLDAVRKITLELENGIETNNLVINEAKKKKNGLLISPSVQLVHAIAVNHATKTRINKNYTKFYQELGERYLLAAKNLSIETLQEVAGLRRKLLGCINYSKQADLSPVRGLTATLKSGDSIVRRNLTSSGVTRSKKWWVRNKKTDRAAELTKRWRELSK